MARASTHAAASAERFFQFSLLGLVTSGYLAVAGSGYLDAPTIVLTALALALRALLVAGAVRLEISPRVVTALTIAYIGFFPLDYLFFARGFLEATVHLVFFLVVVKVATARTNRDYLYLATIAFLELLAAAMLSASFSFFAYLALYLVFAIGAFTSAEIRRSLEQRQAVARNGMRHFSLRLGSLAGEIALGILVLTAGLFFVLPRTADAAFRHLIARRFYLPGFSDQVRLGEIGEVKTSSTPVMHVRFYTPVVPPNLHWRGGALSHFNGRTWANPAGLDQRIPVERGRRELGAGHPVELSYRVELNAIDTDALFFAGTPLMLEIKHASLLRTPGDGYRLGHVPPPGFYYEATSMLEDRGEPARGAGLSAAERGLFLQLPSRLDPRIVNLAHEMAAGQGSDFERARALETRLRTAYAYTLELPSREVSDPLAYFLFERKKGHCEYFASAMAVMLRTLGIPSRLANGFLGGVKNPLTDLYVVRASDAHTWVEAYLAGRGWTTFDPTPPDPNSGRISLWSRLALYADAAETFWQEWVVGYDMGRQGMLADRMQQSGWTWGMRWFERLREARERGTEAAVAGLKRYGLWAGAGVVWAALLAGLLPPFWKRWRTRRGARRLRRGQGSMADATLLYARMLELLRRRGYEKPAWFTPREFAATLPTTELGGLIAQFTTAYNALRFGGRAEAAPQLSALLDKLERREV
ncbi:MAG TPA: transglutaminaseTgpA domain-containing protein [Bryobacteraceae bacterium]|nr:transglutaminaseTgpA domain-containing protein [Bryobacteraceae bacterium]